MSSTHLETLGSGCEECGPRNLSSHFTTAIRKKKVTVNSCVGVYVNPPRREGERSVCMKLNYLNYPAAECSSNFLNKCCGHQWYASLLSHSFPPPFYAGWIPGTQPVRVSSLYLSGFHHWQRQHHLPAQCPATPGTGLHWHCWHASVLRPTCQSGEPSNWRAVVLFC